MQRFVILYLCRSKIDISGRRLYANSPRNKNIRSKYFSYKYVIVRSNFASWDMENLISHLKKYRASRSKKKARKDIEIILQSFCERNGYIGISFYYIDRYKDFNYSTCLKPNEEKS